MEIVYYKKSLFFSNYFLRAKNNKSNKKYPKNYLQFRQIKTIVIHVKKNINKRYSKVIRGFSKREFSVYKVVSISFKDRSKS